MIREGDNLVGEHTLDIYYSEGSKGITIKKAPATVKAFIHRNTHIVKMPKASENAGHFVYAETDDYSLASSYGATLSAATGELIYNGKVGAATLTLDVSLPRVLLFSNGISWIRADING